MSTKRILAVYGHPDDEGQVTGTLARFIAEGAQATLVCATRGEVGEISDPALATPETLWYVRELELRAAMAQIGLRDVRLLPFRDSGMEGTPDNDDPRALHRQPAERVVGELVAIMREVRPHVVFTWDPSGGYGHPDHIAVHRHTLAAFDAAGDAGAYPDTGPAWQPQRLYWGAFTMKDFARIWTEMDRRGLLTDEDRASEGQWFENAANEPDPPVSVVVNVRRHGEAKRRAAAMHRSQFGAGSMFARIPLDLADEIFGDERFYQARPAWPEGQAVANDFPPFGET